MKLRATSFVLVIASLLILGCKGDKRKQSSNKAVQAPKALRGLEAVPRASTAVIGLDVTSLRRAWLVRRAVEEMFRRDPELEQRMEALLGACRVSLGGPQDGDASAEPTTVVSDIVIAMGTPSGRERDEAVMVATGAFVEAKLASCVGQGVAGDGRSLIADMVEGRSLYGIPDNAPVAPSDPSASSGPASKGAGAPAATVGVTPTGPPPKGGPTTPESGQPAATPAPVAAPKPAAGNDVWFSVAGPETLVIATSKSWLIQAVGTGEKIAAAPTMASLLKRVDRGADIWAAGKIDPAVGAGLVDQASGAISAPPQAIFGSLDLRRGMELSLGLQMATDQDAKSLESLVSGQMGLMALAAQRYGVGAWVEKLVVTVEARTVFLRASLSEDDVRQILSRIDSSTGSAQNPADNRGEP